MQTLKIRYIGPPDQAFGDMVLNGIREADPDTEIEAGLEPGAEYDLPREHAIRVVETNAQFEFVNPPKAMADMTVAQLDQLAEEREVEDYPKSGSKADKIAALTAAEGS
jgi:hypothetical protein